MAIGELTSVSRHAADELSEALKTRNGVETLMASPIWGMSRNVASLLGDTTEGRTQ